MILVNLTCGRNPWKRASTEDATFRAYLKDPKFLKTILPLSPELDSILRRIFECDPLKRITIPELRKLIIQCGRFTVQPSTLPPSPPAEEVVIPDFLDISPQVVPAPREPSVAAAPSAPEHGPPRCEPQLSQLTDASGSCSSDDGSVFSALSSGSTGSSLSSSSSSMSCGPLSTSATPAHTRYIPAQPNLCANIFFPAMDLASKHLDHAPIGAFSSVRVH